LRKGSALGCGSENSDNKQPVWPTLAVEARHGIAYASYDTAYHQSARRRRGNGAQSVCASYETVDCQKASTKEVCD
jgi:hypothetical protein